MSKKKSKENCPKKKDMVRNDYVEEIIPREKIWLNQTADNDTYKKQRKKYGFDGRDTISLDYPFGEWLYSRCKMYLEYADGFITDMDDIKQPVAVGGRLMTQKRAIEKILKLTAKYLRNREKNLEKSLKALKKAAHIFADILGAMWW